MEELEQINKAIETQQQLISALNKKWDWSRSYPEWEEETRPFNQTLDELNRRKRMIMPVTYKILPDYGDIMPLIDFINAVKDEWFIDYDGSGNYVKDGQMSNISIYPSDIKYGAIREGFDTIIWFNK